MALIQALEQLVHSLRRGQNNSLVLCILECMLHLLQNIAQYFNKWSFVYVGLYGYDYLTAGKKALELFRSRGWSTIIKYVSFTHIKNVDYYTMLTLISFS